MSHSSAHIKAKLTALEAAAILKVMYGWQPIDLPGNWLSSYRRGRRKLESSLDPSVLREIMQTCVRPRPIDDPSR